MSIKISCDEKATTIFSISISPSYNMARKRLKSTNLLSELIEKLIQIKPTIIQEHKIDNSNEIINLKSIKIHNQHIKMTKTNSKIHNVNNKIIIFGFYYLMLLILFNINHIIRPTNALLNVEPTLLSNSEQQFSSSAIKTFGDGSGSGSGNVGGGPHYLENLDNLERSLAEVLIKVAYGTTSTTKRSIPDHNFVPSLTTAATPSLTTYRYFEKSHQQQQPQNFYHRNYELDLERDHALPTSAPIADILKSNRNPTYPNPNRHYDRDRHRQLINSSPAPSIHDFYKKGQPTIPMYSSDSLSSFSRTPPLPREYENPFNDKPILRGTNSDGAILNNSGGGSSYINRRPIPPPSLMPGRERIPFRPPELSGQNDDRGNDITEPHNSGDVISTANSSVSHENSVQKKKPLNTPTQKGFIDSQYNDEGLNNNNSTIYPTNDNENSNNNNNNMKNSGNFHIPNISRILSGSNGKKEDIPDVLFQQVITNQSEINENNNNDNNNNNNKFSNINQNKFIENSKSTNNRDDDTIIDNTFKDEINNNNNDDKFNDEPKISSTAELPQTNINNNNNNIDKNVFVKPEIELSNNNNNNNNQENIKNIGKNIIGTSSSSSSSSTTAQSETTTWNIAWNIHIYLSVILFTILGVYFIFKIIFYNQLTHLFNQSYFLFIHLILIFICIIRIFYLIYDAYNINLTFNILISELLLNIPSILLLITFSILILYIIIKSLNIKNNRYSTLIRPLTILIGSSVLIGLCITLHYVENYTISKTLLNNQQKQFLNNIDIINNRNITKSGLIIQTSQQPQPARILSLICQIIYIIVCLILGLLYLYIYRLFKRLIKSKTQNYINNNQNLSYAIHITIATALLFILLAAVQIFGTITITTTAVSSKTTKLIIEIDWLQWGYQFSIRLIEITIIWLIGWVAGLKTSLHNEKHTNNDNVNDNSNISGFALFPCTTATRSNHQDNNFDNTEYPNVCNVNINLHSYSKRTGKPLYNDNFTLNTIQNTNLSNIGNGSGNGIIDYGTIDHYENPNFELRGTKLTNHYPQPHENQIDNCYSEPLNLHESNNTIHDNGNRNIQQQQQQQQPHYDQGYGFQNFDRAHFQNRSNFQNRTNLRSSNRNCPTGIDYHLNNNHNHHHHSVTTNKMKNLTEFERSNFENPERHSTNSRKLRGGGCVSGMGNNRNCIIDNNRSIGREYQQQQQQQQHQFILPSDDDIILTANNALSERTNLINNFNNDGTATTTPTTTNTNCDGIQSSSLDGGLVALTSGGNDINANSASMLVADHGFVRFHPLNR